MKVIFEFCVSVMGYEEGVMRYVNDNPWIEEVGTDGGVIRVFGLSGYSTGSAVECLECYWGCLE